MITQNGIASSPVINTSIDITCETSADLTGLEIMEAQVLHGIDKNGNPVTINCTVVSFVENNEIYISVITPEDVDDVGFNDDQSFDFKDSVTGTISGHFVIITDIVIH